MVEDGRALGQRCNSVSFDNAVGKDEEALMIAIRKREGMIPRTEAVYDLMDRVLCYE